jgi:uncharacterized protein (TIGR02145 family)
MPKTHPMKSFFSSLIFLLLAFIVFPAGVAMAGIRMDDEESCPSKFSQTFKIALPLTVVLGYHDGFAHIPDNARKSFSHLTSPVMNEATVDLPVAFQLIGGGTFCSYEYPVSFTQSGSQLGVTYRLYRDDVIVANQVGTGFGLNWSCSQAGSYHVDGVNEAGTTPMLDTILLLQHLQPLIYLSVSSTVICSGDSVTMNVITENPGNYSIFLWWINTGGQLIHFFTSEPFYKYIPSDQDQILVDLIESDPCNYTAISNTVEISVITSSTGGSVSGDKSIYLGYSTDTLTIEGYQGAITGWQKSLNRGNWINIQNTQTSYCEIPISSGIWKYRAIIQSESCPAVYSQEATVNVLERTLSVKLLPQGLFNPFTQYLNKSRNAYGDQFQSDTTDLITIRLFQNTAPYDEVYSFNNIALPSNGIITVNLPSHLHGEYFLAINHRNSIETWSSGPLSFFGNTIYYDFTDDADKAYGSNLKEIAGNWVIYGGDVNQDGIVDSDDIVRTDNMASIFKEGYIVEDVNGDALVDAGDMLIVDNNSNTFVGAMFPYSQDLPVIITFPPSNVTLNTVTACGRVNSQGSTFVSQRGVCWSIAPDPTINDFHLAQGCSTGNFSCIITGLNYGTQYYFRAYATNSSGTAYGDQFCFRTRIPGGGSPCPGIPQVSIGIQTYNTVMIGEQCWMAENINVGIRINSSQPPSDNNIIEKHCYNDLETNCDLYGGTYKWNEMMQYTTYQSGKGICPPGWHIPSNTEWNVLSTYLGGWLQAGGKMKETGTKHWSTPNSEATNSSGFSAIPNNDQGQIATWMGSTVCEGNNATNREANFYTPYLYPNTWCSKSMVQGEASVRCLMDDSLKLASVTTLPVTDIADGFAYSGGEVVPDGGTDVIAKGICWSTHPCPSINDEHTVENGGYGSFTGILSGLMSDSVYYVRAYANNSAGVAYGNERSLSTAVHGIPCPDLIAFEFENRSYHTVQIGNQCWMKENLNVGDRISGILEQSDNSIIEKYCYNNLEENCEIYGGLYQWEEAMQYSSVQGQQGICPAGWHIPVLKEWDTLVEYLGGNEVAGGKLKDFGTSIWSSPNTGATNESGFSALPSGIRNLYSPNGNFEALGSSATFWSSNADFDPYYWTYDLDFNSTGVNKVSFHNNSGLSIRCIRNDSLQLSDVITSPVTYITSNSAQTGGFITYEGGSPILQRGVCYDTIPNPTINGLHTLDGIGIGSFISYLSGLQPNTIYYVKAYSLNSGDISYGEEITFTTFDTVITYGACAGLESITYGGQVYNTIQVGEQCWLKENLNIGTKVSVAQNQTNNGVIEKYCLYDAEVNCSTYGGLYQWKEAMSYNTAPGSQGICPDGWHIPSDQEWCVLTQTIDPSVDCNTGGWSGNDIGIKMKSTTGWIEGGNGSNASGFTGLPAGYRFFDGSTYEGVGSDTFFWSSNSFNNYSSWHRSLSYYFNKLYRFYDSKDFGFSVRCIKN